MKNDWTEEEKGIAKKLLKQERVQTKISDESLQEVVVKIVRLSQEGLREEEIVEKLKGDIVITHDLKPKHDHRFEVA